MRVPKTRDLDQHKRRKDHDQGLNLSVTWQRDYDLDRGSF